jgi:hypothetical protein
MLDKWLEAIQACPDAIRESTRTMSEIDRAIPEWPVA